MRKQAEVKRRAITDPTRSQAAKAATKARQYERRAVGRGFTEPTTEEGEE